MAGAEGARGTTSHQRNDIAILIDQVRYLAAGHLLL